MEHVHCDAPESLCLSDHLILLGLGDPRGVLDRVDDLSQTRGVLDDLERLHPVLGVKSPSEVSDVVCPLGTKAALVGGVHAESIVTDASD